MAKRKRSSNSNLITSLLYIIIGVVLAVFPGDALKWAMIVAGVAFIVFGALELIKKNFIGGAVSLIVGIVILILGNTLLDVVLLVLGILIAIKGVISLIGALRRSKISTLEVVFALLTIVIGVIVAFGNALHIVLIIGGVLLIINGIVGLVSYLKK